MCMVAYLCVCLCACVYECVRVVHHVCIIGLTALPHTHAYVYTMCSCGLCPTYSILSALTSKLDDSDEDEESAVGDDGRVGALSLTNAPPHVTNQLCRSIKSPLTNSVDQSNHRLSGAIAAAVNGMAARGPGEDGANADEGVTGRAPSIYV